MNYIIGDIGNTSTRICLLNNSKIFKSLIFDTKNIFIKGYIKKIFNRFFQKNLKREILFSCVVPLALKEIKKALKKTNYKVFTPYFRRGCLNATEPRRPLEKPKNINFFAVKNFKSLSPQLKIWRSEFLKWSEYITHLFFHAEGEPSLRFFDIGLPG